MEDGGVEKEVEETELFIFEHDEEISELHEKSLCTPIHKDAGAE